MALIFIDHFDHYTLDDLRAAWFGPDIYAMDHEDSELFSFPPQRNPEIGCSCIGAVVYTHKRISDTGVRTKTWRCGKCGDARVERL